MNGLLKQWAYSAGLAVLLLCSGCIGPRYTEHDIVVTGKPAAKIHGPHDPALQADLSTNLWRSQPFPGRAVDVGATLFKAAGIQGWKDYHMNACAIGVPLHHEFATGPFLTIDLRLKSLTVNRVRVPLHGPRYMRVVIFLAKASVAHAVYKRTNSMVIAQGKLVWNFDGWLEIHPQRTGDVVLAPGISPLFENHGTAVFYRDRTLP